MQIFSSSYNSSKNAQKNQALRSYCEVRGPGLGQGLRNCPQSRNRFHGNETTSLYSCSWELFILVCIVWNCWRTCLLKTYLMFVVQLFVWCVRLCAFYVKYYSFLPERFCHEHQFGLNSRIAAPKFCTKSRFYFLRRNLFERFAPTLPKSKIAWMEILFSAIWAKLKVLTISSYVAVQSTVLKSPIPQYFQHCALLISFPKSLVN